MHIRYILESLLEDDQPVLFAKWAWGNDIEHVELDKRLADLWNERHGEKMLLKYEGRPFDDIPKMIELWRITDES